MQALRQRSIAGRSPQKKPFPSLQISKAGQHHFKTGKKTLDLQSTSTNHGSRVASLDSSSDEREERLASEDGEVYHAVPGDDILFHLHSHPEWFSIGRHESRTIEFLAAFDAQFSSGRIFIKLPFQDDYCFGEKKKRSSGLPSLISDISTISTALRTVTLEPIDQLRVVHGPAAWPPPTTQLSPTGAIISENLKRQSLPPVPEDFHEDASTASSPSTESRSGRSNAVELPDPAVIETLAPEVRPPANFRSGRSNAVELPDPAVIETLAPEVRPPANFRSLVYGVTTHGNGGSESSKSANPSPEHKQGSRKICHNAQRSSKKRRPDQDDDEDAEDQDPKNPRSRRRVYSKTRVSKRNYACHFNIMNPRRYCVRNELGGTGNLYSPCMGTGWAELHGLLVHLMDCHTPHQCTRCWKVFDEPEQLTFHRDKQEPRCVDYSLVIECREGIDPDKCKSVADALKTPRSKTKEQKSPFQKWMEVWDIMFPVDIYPNLPRPTHPYYVDPQNGFDCSESTIETDRRLLIARGIWNERARIAASGTSQEEYHPGWEEVEHIIRGADAIIANSSQQSFQPTPLDQAFLYNNNTDGATRPSDDSGPQGLPTDVTDTGTQFHPPQE